MAGDNEFQIEQAGPALPQVTIKLKAVEGMDSIEIEAPESLAMHLLTEFRMRQDQLAERSISQARELADIKGRMMAGAGQSRIETH